MGASLHPYFALRFAGLPAAAARLSGGDTLAMIDARARDGEDVQRACKDVCEALEAYCPRIADQAGRRALLDAKRSFHNHRRPKPDTLARLMPLLPPALGRAVGNGVSMLERWKESDADIEGCYATELASERASLRRLYDVATFRTAVQISNPLLAARLDKLFGERGESMSEKDRGALWSSLAAYALRATCKTSPQSSFGTVAIGCWTEDGPSCLPAFDDTIESRFDLRKAPLEQLLKPLLRRVDALDPQAVLRINPSLRAEGGKWRWLRIDDSERGNDRTLGAVTTSMQIDANKPLQMVLARFRESSDARHSVTDVRHFLAAKLPPAVHESIPTLLQRLLDLHLLETMPEPQQVGAIETWRRGAALLDVRLRVPVEAALAALERSMRELAGPSRDEAPRELRRTESAFEELGAATGRTVRAADYRPIVHDDCTLAELRLAPAAIGEIITDLTRLLDLTCLLGGVAGHAPTGFVATALFLERYGPDGVCTDTADFLAAVAGRVGSAGAQRSGGSEDGGWTMDGRAPFDTARQLTRLSDRLGDRLADLAENGEDRVLDWDVFAPLLAEIPAAIRRRGVSHCINGQIVDDTTGAARFVINQIYPGRSRMISRFLPDRPDVRARVLAYLKEVAGSRMPVAIPGVFGFNANLHPRFLDREVDIGPFAPDREDTQKVALADLTLRYDPATEQLVLHDKAGTPIEPVYLGILMSQRLPPLHRTLDCIAGTSEGVTPIWLAIARRMTGFQQTITVVPRLTVGSIVIARRTYYVPKTYFPDCTAGNTAFFRAVQDWRVQHGIPRHVFYHRRLRDPAQALTRPTRALDDAQRQRLRMMFKPIYADLASPTCVQLMRTALAREQEDLVFAEALPDLAQASSVVADAQTVSELSLELTRHGA